MCIEETKKVVQAAVNSKTDLVGCYRGCHSMSIELVLLELWTVNEL